MPVYNKQDAGILFLLENTITVTLLLFNGFLFV